MMSKHPSLANFVETRTHPSRVSTRHVAAPKSRFIYIKELCILILQLVFVIAVKMPQPIPNDIYKYAGTGNVLSSRPFCNGRSWFVPRASAYQVVTARILQSTR